MFLLIFVFGCVLDHKDLVTNITLFGVTLV
jgi:hypothetical protein